jgi:hypothetical protein
MEEKKKEEKKGNLESKLRCNHPQLEKRKNMMVV